jgi:hypothetical protein
MIMMSSDPKNSQSGIYNRKVIGSRKGSVTNSVPVKCPDAFLILVVQQSGRQPTCWRTSSQHVNQSGWENKHMHNHTCMPVTFLSCFASATPSSSPPPQPTTSSYSFLVPHLVNRDDRHLLAWVICPSSYGLWLLSHAYGSYCLWFFRLFFAKLCRSFLVLHYRVSKLKFFAVYR